MTRAFLLEMFVVTIAANTHLWTGHIILSVQCILTHPSLTNHNEVGAIIFPFTQMKKQGYDLPNVA